MCRGKDADGSQCICTRSTATKEDDQGRNVCVNCGHIESAHPLDVPRPGALVRKFRDAALLPRKASTTGSTSALKATEEEAIAETSSGLRKRKPATDTEPPSSKKVKKEKDTAKEKDSGRAKVFPAPWYLPFILTFIDREKATMKLRLGKLCFCPAGSP